MSSSRLIGSIICLNPPDTRYTCVPLWCSVCTNSCTPLVRVCGCDSSSLSSPCLFGCMMSSL
jgi:hypothetical protein